MSILSNYNVSFGVRIFFNTEYAFISSINDSLDGFIVEIDSTSRATSDKDFSITINNITFNLFFDLNDFNLTESQYFVQLKKRF